MTITISIILAVALLYCLERTYRLKHGGVRMIAFLSALALMLWGAADLIRRGLEAMR